MTQRPSDSLIDTTVLGRYRVLRKLARGGMGAVYLARTEGAAGFARPVVIKRILPTLMDDDEVARMFVREAQLLSNFQHANIVSVVDFGQDDDGAYVMVLEYVHGYHVGQWLRFVQQTRGTIPVDIVLHIMIRVLDALHYAHTFRRSDGTTLEIIHRDVSPSNILLDAQGQVKLLDFGVARVSGDESTLRSQRGKRLTGKLPYLPVELFKGEDPSVQSDVYSTGVVLYELLTGNNPFAGRETADICHRVLTVEPTPIHALREDAPDGIDEVLLKALSRDRRQRFRNAAMFSQALRGLRTQAEDLVAERLSLLVADDFANRMPELLGLEPLAVREQSWRSPSAAPPPTPSGPPGPSMPPPPPAGAVLPEPESATVRTDVPDELLAEAARVSLPGITVHGVQGDPAKPPSDRAPGHRSNWILAGLAVAVLLGGVSLGLNMSGALNPGGGGEKIVYIERLPTQNTRGATVEATELPSANLADSLEQATRAVPADAPSDGSAQASGAQQAAPDPRKPSTANAAAHPQPAAPRAPNPRRLTRRFGRRQKRVEACFAQHAAALEGKPQLSIRFSIDEQGRVQSAKVLPDRVHATPLGACLMKVAETTSFGRQQRPFSFRIPITAEWM